MAGSNVSNNSREREQVYFGHYPAGSSFRNWQHIKQMHDSGKVADFDYGPEKNVQLYGQEKPPVIDFSPIENAGIPIAMYVAKHDLIVQL